MADRDHQWRGGNAAPCEGNRFHRQDPGRAETAERISEAQKRKPEAPEQPAKHPGRRWHPSR
jgi:hypothetical protein